MNEDAAIELTRREMPDLLSSDSRETFSFPKDAKPELEIILRKHGRSVEDFLEPLEQFLNSHNDWPWAIVLFRDEVPLAGHLASIRGMRFRLPVACYSRRQFGEINDEESVPPVSILFIPRKAVLRDMAEKSMLLEFAWNRLRECPEDRKWICISDSPPEEWIRKTSAGDAARFLEAADAERKHMEPPGYAFLDDRKDYQRAIAAATDGDHSAMRLYAEQFSKAFPWRPRGQLLLGDAYFALGSFPVAMMYYRQAILLERHRARRLVGVFCVLISSLHCLHFAR